MRVLIYKRTHQGDPDAGGCFGANDCMGSFRGRQFEAVIGIGGIGRDAREKGIAEKVNWIGIGRRTRLAPSKRGPEVLFDHFLNFGEHGPRLQDVAPNLASRMYGRNVRCVVLESKRAGRCEVESVLRLALGAPPSPSLRQSVASNVPPCRSRATERWGRRRDEGSVARRTSEIGADSVQRCIPRDDPR